MESLDGKKKHNRIGKTVLPAALLAMQLLHPEGSQAGKREALRLAEGLKMSEALKPKSSIEQKPEEPPKLSA